MQSVKNATDAGNTEISLTSTVTEKFAVTV